MALLGAITVDSVRAAQLSKHKYRPAEALFEYTEGDSMVNDPQYIQDSPAGYNVDNQQLQLESQISKHHNKKHHSLQQKVNTDANWDDEGAEQMDEEDYKADAPSGYDDAKIKARRHHGHSHHHHNPRSAYMQKPKQVQKNKIDWTEEHAEHMDEENYEKDIPAGYKVEEEKAPVEPTPAPAEAPQPDADEDVQRKHHNKHHKSRGPKNHVRMQYDDIEREHPWGSIQEEDTSEWLHDNNLRDSNTGQWKTDAPNGYHQAPYEVANVQYPMNREFPWGGIQEEDTWEYIGSKRDENSEEKDYMEDTPAGYAAVPYDAFVQTGAQLNKWGVISPEDDPSSVVGKAYASIAQNSADFSKDSPAGYDLIQLNTNKWGVIDEEDTYDW